MFFSRSLRTTLLEEEKKQQRRFLYSELYKALQQGEFWLVWPINQIIDPNNARMKGYCHGYSEVWTKQLLHIGEEEPFLSEAAWASLIQDEHYVFSAMPLSPSIKLAQTFMYSGPAYRARGEAVDCADLDLLLEQLLAGTLKTLSLENLDQYHVFVVCLGSKKDASCFSVLDLRSEAKWHEARLCVDPKGYVHWFDANVGWFRSRTTYPALNDLKQDLNSIFEILQYPQKYSVVSVFETMQEVPRVRAYRNS